MSEGMPNDGSDFVVSNGLVDPQDVLDEGPRVLTPEEAEHGIFLQPDESVAVDLVADGSVAHRNYDAGNGMTITGQAVASLEVGGRSLKGEQVARATVLAGTENGTVLMFPSMGNKPASLMALTPGSMSAIGRDIQGLPDNVSSDHCAVGLDSNGRFVVENHNPSNFTRVQAFN
jgi:hypothetical protein